MHFHFLLTNHYPYGLYKIEDHVRLISAGLVELGHRVSYGFDDDVAPWPSINLLVEFFNDSPVVDQVIGLKSGRLGKYAFGLICYEDLQDDVLMRDTNFPLRRESIERLVASVDFTWTVVPCDYSALSGADRVRFLKYGYAGALVRPDLPDRDIDVLIYSDLGPRRLPLFNALLQRGLAASATFGLLPGYFKNDLLDRSRVIADVIRSDNARFLSPSRICVALHTGALIVSEPRDKGPLAEFYQYTVQAEFDRFADICAAVVRDPAALRLGQVARERFSRETSMAANLKAAMNLPVFAEAAQAEGA